MRRKYSVLAAAFVALAALLPVSPAAGAATRDGASGETTTGSIAWAPCEEEPTAECGKLAVPVDWSNPNGEKIDLAIARRKATDPAARVGSLVINPGGPGGSGVESVYGATWFTDELQRRFDIVGFDPRGVGRSHPVICSASVYNQMPHTVISSQAQFDAWDAFTKKLHKDCRERTGPLYDHVDSRNVARDMDALRAALGEEKLTYYGISYGTLIGQMYAEMFPNRIRALALDSNMDHSLGVAGFLATEAVAVEDAFDEFVGWCEADESCVLHGRDVRAMWRDLLAKARRGELYYPTAPDKPMTELQVIYNAALGTEGPDWRTLSEVINWLSGGPEPSWVPPLPGRGPVEGDVAELPTRILCQDYNLRVRNYAEYAALMKVSNSLAPDVRYHPFPYDDLPICLNSTPTNPPHALRYTGDAPILLGNSLHDPATPYMWSANVGRQLGSKATLLTYEGWGHRIYGKDECSTVPIDNFLISLTVPPKGYRCEVGGKAEIMAKRQPGRLWPTDRLNWGGSFVSPSFKTAG